MGKGEMRTNASLLLKKIDDLTFSEEEWAVLRSTNDVKFVDALVLSAVLDIRNSSRLSKALEELGRSSERQAEILGSKLSTALEEMNQSTTKQATVLNRATWALVFVTGALVLVTLGQLWIAYQTFSGKG